VSILRRGARVGSASGSCGRDQESLTTTSNLITACVVTLIVGGCGDPAAHIQPLSPGAVVLAFGDSLTSGKGAATQDTYPSVLSHITGYQVINAGIPGELSATGLERLPAALKSHQPALVILCHGGNDMLQKRSRDETVANLDAMIAMIKQSGADVILVGVPEPGIFVNTASFYGELAEQHGIPYDDETIAAILEDALLKSDYIHPNAAGYRKMAEAVSLLISESQAS
jgi:acyl-CoA thioesterase-1